MVNSSGLADGTSGQSLWGLALPASHGVSMDRPTWKAMVGLGIRALAPNTKISVVCISHLLALLLCNITRHALSPGR